MNMTVRGKMPSLWDRMPADWRRWADLQGRRGPLTDAEWEEFCLLDEKFGPAPGS